tara:strand:- start:597 stop:836 length:240 start_codon:yes stop_codon:yes gene_type:complete
MEILGYKYDNEEEAIAARKECADYYGLPVTPDDVTKYWVDYYEAVDNSPVFWYIEFYESIRAILGSPTTFDVEGEPLLK